MWWNEEHGTPIATNSKNQIMQNFSHLLLLKLLSRPPDSQLFIIWGHLLATSMHVFFLFLFLFLFAAVFFFSILMIESGFNWIYFEVLLFNYLKKKLIWGSLIYSVFFLFDCLQKNETEGIIIYYKYNFIIFPISLLQIYYSQETT